MVSFGKVMAGGVVATLLTGAVATILVQPMILSSIPIAGWAVLLSWALALVVGYIAAGAAWMLVVAALMVTMFREHDDQLNTI